jgi:isoquinoline 1-oxidoreductase beta subunit
MNEATAIEVHIVKSTDAPGGMGEPSASAAMKAVFVATGKRLRKLPIVPAERAYL